MNKNNKRTKNAMEFFLHGGDYNPEQWKYDKSVWDEDMALMQKARCNTVTIGVFAWAEIEPEEGRYDFSVFDEIFARVNRQGGKVILATPSGARPYWAAKRYSEILRTDENGQKKFFGGRHNHCFTSPAYRKLVKNINERLAERYGEHPALLAWHLSNEYSGMCYCALCRKAFSKFLREKYRTIDNLNHEYWASFWSHTYPDFDSVEPPSPMGETSVHALNLDWRRFVTEQTVDFMKEEIQAVRRYSSRPVTTNMMPGYYGLDYYKFAPHLDLISWDSYPGWNTPNHLHDAVQAAFWHDFFRSLKKQPFLLMESAPSLVSWREYNKIRHPDMERAAALQAVAHGSDSVLYFQWRKSRGSCEKFHGAVIDHEGSENTRVFRMVKKTGELLEKIREIAGTDAERSRVAICFDWENMWAYDDSCGFSRNKRYAEDVLSYYRLFWRRGIACDVVNPRADLSSYDLVLAVEQYMTDGETIENFARYVKNGGTLFATCLLGMVNENDLCYLKGFPAGKLKEVFGIWNEEIDTLYPQEETKVEYCGKEYSAERYCEIIHLRGAEALGKYRSQFYENTPCATVNEYGKGKAYYQAFCDGGALKERFISDILQEIGLRGCIAQENLPEGVTAHKRIGKNTEYLFVENYGEKPVSDIALGKEYVNMESGAACDSVDLGAFGVIVLKRIKE